MRFFAVQIVKFISHTSHAHNEYSRTLLIQYLPFAHSHWMCLQSSPLPPCSPFPLTTHWLTAKSKWLNTDFTLPCRHIVSTENISEGWAKVSTLFKCSSIISAAWPLPTYSSLVPFYLNIPAASLHPTSKVRYDNKFQSPTTLTFSLTHSSLQPSMVNLSLRHTCCVNVSIFILHDLLKAHFNLLVLAQPHLGLSSVTAYQQVLLKRTTRWVIRSYVPRS